MAQAGKGLALAVAIGGLVAGGLLFLHYDRILTEPRLQAEEIAQNSPMILEKLGDPLEFGRFPQAKLHGDNNAHLAIGVSGPAGTGTLVEWAQQDAGHWRICSLVFRWNGTGDEFELVDGAETHCAPE